MIDSMKCRTANLLAAGVLFGGASVALSDSSLFTSPLITVFAETTADREDHVAAGDAAMLSGEYEKAVKEYAEAIRTADTDPMVWVKLGDAHNYLAADDPSNLLKARAVWDAAVSNNPKLLIAHRRLLQLYQDYADVTTGADRVKHLEKVNATATAILGISPHDADARFLVQEVIIDKWLSGQATTPEQIDGAIAELRKLAVEQPENAEIPFAIGRALASRGMEAMRSGNLEQTKKLYDEANKVIDDALAARPEDSKLLFRKVQLMMAIGPRVEALDRNDASFREKSRQLATEVTALCKRAVASMKSDDDEFLPLVRTAALMYQRSDENDLAEASLRRAMEKFPHDASVRLQLAELLRTDPRRLNEAAQLLSEWTPNPKSVPGVKGMQAREAQYGVSAVLADIKLDQYMASRGTDPNAPVFLNEAAEALTELTSREPNSPRLLRIKGKLQLFQGNSVEAIQTLNKALAQSKDGDRTYFEIKYLLGRAYSLNAQNDEAEKYMREIADRLDYFPAQLELCRLLLAKRDFPGAAKVLDILKAKSPNSPEVINLQTALNQLGAQPLKAD